MARPTLTDIARASGVTTGAVSLILRHKGRFAATTRERVLAAAQRLQYRPDPVLASLRTGKFKKSTSTQATPVALVWNLSKPVLGRTLQKAESLGYKLTAYDLSEYENPKRLGDVLYARGVRGIILSQLYAREALPDLGWDRFACVCVCVARPYFPVPFDIVRDKVTEPFVFAVRRCLDLGYRRIGIDAMIHRCWGRRHPDDRLRHAAALYCHTLIPKHDRIPIHFGRTKESESFIKWYRRHRPEVVIGCGSDRYFQLIRHGIAVPQETAFCALRLND